MRSAGSSRESHFQEPKRKPAGEGCSGRHRWRFALSNPGGGTLAAPAWVVCTGRVNACWNTIEKS